MAQTCNLVINYIDLNHIYDSPKRPHEITFINPDGSVNKVVSQLVKPFKPCKHNKPNISKNHRK